MLLAKKGAVLNAEDEDGHTPAQWASDAGNSNALRLLIALGAPPPSFYCEDSEEDVEDTQNSCEEFEDESEYEEEDFEELGSEKMLQEVEAL